MHCFLIQLKTVICKYLYKYITKYYELHENVFDFVIENY